MPKRKIETPYQRLLYAVRNWRSRIQCPKRVRMFRFPAKQVGDQGSFRLDRLAERVQAANSLGYDVVMRWEEGGGLVAEYIERPGDIEYSIW